MAYFRPSVDADGIHIPTYDDILSYLTEQYKSIFGDDVYLGIDSKDYQLLSVFAKTLDDFAALSVDCYNARSPLYATGDSLDVLCTIVGITRNPATHGEAEITLTGIDDTVVEAGSKVIDKDGGLWTITEDVTIASGTATAEVTKDEAGAYKLIADSISSIYTPVVGWSGVSNTTIGTVGSNVETDAELRVRMQRSLISKATFNIVAIENAIWDIFGVTNVKIFVNDTDTTDDNGIPSHSICAFVKGGDDQEIADAIFNTKSPGIGTYGTTTETVIDAYGNENSVSFMRATEVEASVSLTGIVYDLRTDVDILKANIKSAVASYLNNLDIGESVTINRLYNVVYSVTGAESLSISALSMTGTQGTKTDTFVIDWDEKVTVDESDITLTITNPD